MNLPLTGFSIFEAVNIILVIVLIFLGFKFVESFWSYKISKPYAWKTAVTNKLISKELLKIERGYQDKVRLYNLWFQVEQLKKNKISGAFAELGVFQGETAKAIHCLDNSRIFYLFDTYKGFTKEDLSQENQTEDRFSTDMFANTNVDKVKKYINGNSNLRFKPGFFPNTAKGLETENFALVHIDADLYAPTIEALKFFYSRLNKGGVIIVHDYNHNWDGIPKAINEFMKTIPESLIELSDWQGSAMIIKNS
ncbi:MAG: class I SAM-dependent methyltransferase [Crocinitomicaceae bacterium]|nr:class I SAM-dependent methyltransferase [Crocinitomicaceae bacterium]